MSNTRESFVVFRNWVQAIDELPEEFQLSTYKALAQYGLTQQIPEHASPVTKALLVSFSVGLENSIARYNASVENGKKGGNPNFKKGQPNPYIHSKNKEQKTPNSSQIETSIEQSDQITQDNLAQPKHNLNDNYYDNNNDNIYENDNDIASEKNVFNNYQEECERVRERNDEQRAHFVRYFTGFFDWTFTEPWVSLGYEVVDTMIEALEQAEAFGLKFKNATYTKKQLDEIIHSLNSVQFRKIVSQLHFNKEIKNRPYYILGCFFAI